MSNLCVCPKCHTAHKPAFTKEVLFRANELLKTYSYEKALSLAIKEYYDEMKEKAEGEKS